MDFYAKNTMLGTFLFTHISLPDASMVIHMQDPYSEFRSHMVYK